MAFNERYMPLLHQANLLVVTNIVRRDMPVFNATAIMVTVMVDRWKPETHSFHLLCGEMTVTLEDVAMILWVADQRTSYHRSCGLSHVARESSRLSWSRGATEGAGREGARCQSPREVAT
jgi:hypothetical protein